MRTYIKLTRNFLKIIRKKLYFWRNTWYFNKYIEDFIMLESCFWKKYVVFLKHHPIKAWTKTNFMKKLQANTLWDRFCHDSLNEFDGCGGPSHSKTIGLHFCLERPSDWLSVGWIACLKKMRTTKHSDRWALGWTAFFFF